MTTRLFVLMRAAHIDRLELSVNPSAHLSSLSKFSRSQMSKIDITKDVCMLSQLTSRALGKSVLINLIELIIVHILMILIRHTSIKHTAQVDTDTIMRTQWPGVMNSI